MKNSIVFFSYFYLYYILYISHYKLIELIINVSIANVLQRKLNVHTLQYTINHENLYTLSYKKI